MIQPWARQDQESDLSWKGFTFYRDATRPRSLAEASRYLRIPQHELITLANDNEWKARVLAYDRFVDDHLVAERLEMISQDDAARTSDQLRLMANAREVCAREIMKLLLASKENEGPMMRVADVIKMTDMAVKLERLLRGQATEILQAGVTPPNLDNLSLEELQAMRASLDKAGVELDVDVLDVPAESRLLAEGD